MIYSFFFRGLCIIFLMFLALAFGSKYLSIWVICVSCVVSGFAAGVEYTDNEHKL